MYKWQDFLIDLPAEVAESSCVIELQCPKCNHKRKKNDKPTLNIFIQNQQWFCKHCGFAGNLLQGVQQ